MKKVRTIVRALVWLLPACRPKNALLRALGHDVHRTARARANVVWKVERVVLRESSRIGRWNLIKNMREVRLEPYTSVGRMNVISSHPAFVRLYSSGGVLRLDHHAKITSRHQLDCSGSVSIGAYASIAGHETQIMSHSIDVRRDAQAAYPITIGERSFVGTRCVILGGAVLPQRSLLAAGGVLVRQKEAGEPGLWSGVPATRRGDIAGAWFDRETTATSRIYVPETDTIVGDAL